MDPHHDFEPGQLCLHYDAHFTKVHTTEEFLMSQRRKSFTGVSLTDKHPHGWPDCPSSIQDVSHEADGTNVYQAMELSSEYQNLHSFVW